LFGREFAFVVVAGHFQHQQRRLGTGYPPLFADVLPDEKPQHGDHDDPAVPIEQQFTQELEYREQYR
jgi:hypothetical protein